MGIFLAYIAGMLSGAVIIVVYAALIAGKNADDLINEFPVNSQETDN